MQLTAVHQYLTSGQLSWHASRRNHVASRENQLVSWQWQHQNRCTLWGLVDHWNPNIYPQNPVTQIWGNNIWNNAYNKVTLKYSSLGWSYDCCRQITTPPDIKLHSLIKYLGNRRPWGPMQPLGTFHVPPPPRAKIEKNYVTNLDWVWLFSTFRNSKWLCR